MKRLKEQQDKINEISAERKRLSEELERIKKEYEQKDLELSQKSSKVAGIGSYNFEEAMKIICYLVSLVEGKKYTYHEQELPLVEYVSGVEENLGWCYVSPKYYDHSAFKHKIKLQFICSDEVAAFKELNEAISEVHAMGYSIYCSEPLPRLYKLLTTPARNYVQIGTNNGCSCFCKEDNGTIVFHDNEDFYKCRPLTLINYDSKICDPSFMYIVDFMNYLTVMKLEKEDFTLTQEEMMAYARDFAEEVKKSKRGECQILKKVVIDV